MEKGLRHHRGSKNDSVLQSVGDLCLEYIALKEVLKCVGNYQKVIMIIYNKGHLQSRFNRVVIYITIFPNLQRWWFEACSTPSPQGVCLAHLSGTDGRTDGRTFRVAALPRDEFAKFLLGCRGVAWRTPPFQRRGLRRRRGGESGATLLFLRNDDAAAPQFLI